jgi:uncharacterized protein YcbK (DUF882 family)
MQCKCKACGNTCAMSDTFMTSLQKLRDIIGVPFKINSGFRCNSHNTAIGGVSNSWHTKGKACDITIKKNDLVALEDIELIANEYFEEVILYKKENFIHVANNKR